MHFIDPHVRFRIERLVRHLVTLGERTTFEFLIEGVRDADDLSRLIDRLRQYERCSPELLRVLGGHRFPPRLSMVPR